MGPRRTYKVCGYQQITSLAASVGLKIPTTDGQGNTCKPNAVLLFPEGQNVRWRADGTAPAAGVGMLLPSTATAPFYYDGDLNAIRFIEDAGDAKLNVVYVEDVNAT